MKNSSQLDSPLTIDVSPPQPFDVCCVLGLAPHSGESPGISRFLGSLAAELLSCSHDETDGKRHSRKKVFALSHSGRGQSIMVGKL